MKELLLKPKPGLKVKDPVTGKPLADDGETKPATTYWLRRLAEGDVMDLNSETVEGDDL